MLTPEDMTTIAKNLRQITDQIRHVAQQVGRSPDAVQLLAVTKGHCSQVIQSAIDAGQTAFAENYVQEALVKQQELADKDIEWHFIGPIQSNKTRAIAENFAWVHSIDRGKIAERLSQQRPTSLPPLNVCIQVNINEEATKSGVRSDQVVSLAQEIKKMPGLKLRGLMAIPKSTANYNEQWANFTKVAEILSKLQQLEFALDTLSMGMSQDYEAAIAAGATIVRIGTKIFGTRPKK